MIFRGNVGNLDTGSYVKGNYVENELIPTLKALAIHMHKAKESLERNSVSDKVVMGVRVLTVVVIMEMIA